RVCEKNKVELAAFCGFRQFQVVCRIASGVNLGSRMQPSCDVMTRGVKMNREAHLLSTIVPRLSTHGNYPDLYRATEATRGDILQRRSVNTERAIGFIRSASLVHVGADSQIDDDVTNRL